MYKKYKEPIKVGKFIICPKVHSKTCLPDGRNILRLESSYKWSQRRDTNLHNQVVKCGLLGMEGNM